MHILAGVLSKTKMDILQENIQAILVIVILLVFFLSFFSIKKINFKSMVIRFSIAMTVLIFLFILLLVASMLTKHAAAVDFINTGNLNFGSEAALSVYINHHAPPGVLRETIIRYPSLKKVDLRCSYPGEIKFLSHLESLEALNIYANNFANWSVLILNINGVELDLRPYFIQKNRRIRSDELPDFRNFKNLKEIGLICEFNNTHFFDQISDLKIKKICLFSSVMSMEGFEKLIQTPGIEAIGLDDIEIFGINDKAIDPNPSIKMLEVNIQDIPTSLIKTMMVAMPNLEYLCLTEVKIDKIEFPDGFALNHLRDLNLHFSKISAQDLENILKIAPELKVSGISCYPAFTIEELQALFKKLNRE